MKTWDVFVQYNGEEASKFSVVSVPISEKLYSKILARVRRKQPLNGDGILSELTRKAEKIADLSIINEVLDDLWITKPERDDYDNYSEYREALREYKEEVNSVKYDWGLVDLTVDDPNDLECFKDKIVGLNCPSWKGKHTKALEFDETWESCTRTSVTLCLDESGTIVGVSNVECSGLEMETEKSSSWGPCYPDYESLFEQIVGRIEEENEKLQ